MTQTIFHTGLNDFCRKAFVGSEPLPAPEVAQGILRAKALEAEIFEQLLLFDRITFKIHGETPVVPFLLKILGQKGLESLIEQDALGFTLWTPSVTYALTEIPGIDPLQYGAFNSPAHSDPEQSLELCFKFTRPALDRSVRRHLLRKLRPLFELPRSTLSAEAVQLTNSAFKSGKLQLLGFPQTPTDLRALNLKEREQLCACATELLEYKYLIESEMTSYTSHQYYDLFQESATKLERAKRIPESFRAIAKHDGLPDLRALFLATDQPFSELPRLRAKRGSKQFREWLANVTDSEPASEITRAYIDALEAPKGFFETRTGKITKAVIKTGAGVGAAHAVSGTEGLLVGIVAASLGKPVLDASADLGLDLLDEFVLAKWIKGWSPRVFMRDLKKLPPAIPPDPWDR